jgi:hypothetical protein
MFQIRVAQAADVEDILSILIEVAPRVPIDLSTPERVEAVRAQIKEYSRPGGCSFVAIDAKGMVVAFQLAEKIQWLDGPPYIHLVYAGTTCSASCQGAFRQLIEAEKALGMSLVARVKSGNKSGMNDRLMRYGFRPTPRERSGSEPMSHIDGEFAYRWDPV